jgi:hypothetical protein
MESDVPVVKVDPLDEKLEINSLHIPGYGIMKLETAKREAQVSSGMAHEFAQDGKHEHAHYHSQRAAMFLRAIKNHEDSIKEDFDIDKYQPKPQVTAPSKGKPLRVPGHVEKSNLPKMTPDNQLYDAGKQTGMGSEAFQPESLDVSFENFLVESTAHEIKQHFDPNMHMVEGGKSVKGIRVADLKQKMRGKIPQDQKAFMKHIYNAGLNASWGTHANALIVHESVKEDVIINEAKRRLGIIRGTTVTGQRANPIDVQPELKLNKGKALKAIKSKGF